MINKVTLLGGVVKGCRVLKEIRNIKDRVLELENRLEPTSSG